ncbi:DUF3433 domain-containing protein [Aspergillus homomorphus CBS 101889]|uniref:Altered inheritance of mitochondria protein 11 n=1 Tax=Aspergillus homomorphus (strain CBS 101889) TaxID=1450537 RepID=A0A395HWC8_ASPHC|nr:hypothetical protein BO97DRAFT_345362 [Aspergillus homomorphus CBS 101889]RAL12211.1 hypothetical protein BO97DRAFT_345362 [Aspergillus homomorphus CBS 101889]
MLAPGSGNVSLRTVSSSRPQMIHTEDQQSVAASDDYYSFSSQSSSARSRMSGSRVNVVRYATPNSRPASRTPSPSISRTHLAPPVAGTRSQPSVESSSDNRNFTTPASHTIRSVEDREVHLSPMSNTTSSQAPADSYAGRPPTPGMDDSPYIHFAISQLTRDEEVAGPRRRSSIVSHDSPAEPLLWDDGLGCFIRSHCPSSTAEIRHQQASPVSARRSPRKSVDPESFIPVEPPEDSLLYPALDYVPPVLRTWALAALTTCCLLMIAGIIFCNIWSTRQQGLWGYEQQTGSHYFVMQFLPQILGIAITGWTFVVQAAVYRVMPFAIMASERPFDRVLQSLPVLSRNFIVPDFSHFRHGEALVGFSLLSMWISNLIALPLLSCLFQAKWYVVDNQGTWRWASVQAVGWTLVAIYSLMTIGLILLMLRFVRTWSGLMWDPVSLADLISVIQRSNILHDFEQSETLPHVGESLDPRILRLGYWQLSNRGETFYGIGEADAPIRTPSLHHLEKNLQMQSHGLSKVSFDHERQGMAEKGEYCEHLYAPSVRYRWVPWFLKDSSVIAWTVIICALFIAFVLVSFIHDAIRGGFPPRLPTLPSTGAFSSSNFCYSFVPALIGNVFFLAWQPIDVFFRASQPFASLSSSKGARAEESLLLAYPSCLPFQVTALAVINKHYKVAWISFMSVASAVIPILAGGVFIALNYPAEHAVKIAASMPAFYALVAFCALYTVSFLCIWPRRQRYLPHDISTLADLMSFLYQSPLLADKILREPRSKVDLVTRLVVAPPGDREHSVYGFGIYTCNIPKSVHLPLEDTVTSLFFSSYLYSPKDPLIREGFMEMVPQAYSNAQPGSHLKLITLAVSFFSVSAWTGNRSYLRAAEQLCLQAISKTREAIQGGIDQNQDEILMTVLLLSIYEEFSALKERRPPGKTHLRGAIALVNSRSPDQRETDIAITLENAVHAQLIKTSKGLAYPVMQTPKVWPPAPVAPESASTQLLMATSELVSLRQAWDKLVLDVRADNVTEIEAILARAMHLDTRLVAWTHALPLHWHPVPATMICESIRKAGMYKNRCDCYSDIWIASTWNFYRDSRIVIQNIILGCLRMLPPPLRTDNIQCALDIIQDLATGICATIPYFLGSQSMPARMGMEKIDYPEADGRRVTAAHRQTSPLLGGWLASTNLLNMAMLPLTDELHAWILEQKQRAQNIRTPQLKLQIQPLTTHHNLTRRIQPPYPLQKAQLNPSKMGLLRYFIPDQQQPSTNSATPSEQTTTKEPTSTSTDPSNSRPQTTEFDPPLPKLWTPQTNLKLLVGGLAFFTLSVLTTRRAIRKRALASIPPFYTSAPYHKPAVSGGVEAFEALNLATLNVLSFAMMSTGGVLYAMDINGVDDMRRYVRRAALSEEDAAKGLVEGDREMEREVEEWAARVLGEKFGKELKVQREKELAENAKRDGEGN